MCTPSTYIKVDRNLLTWRWFQNADTLKMWLYLLLKANIEDRDFEGITIHRGELATSYPRLMADLGMTLQQVRTNLGHLKATGEITATQHRRFQVISILCYDKYQGIQQAKQQAVNRLSTPIKEYKNNSSNTIVLEHTSNAYRCAEFLDRKLRERDPNRKPRTEKDLQRWAADFDKCARLDGRPWEEISETLGYTQRNSFWQRNIMSGAKFRKQMDTIRQEMISRGES